MEQPSSQPQTSSAERKRERQKRSRRLKTIFKKVYEFSTTCDSNVFFGVQMKDNGRVSIFSVDSSGIWSSALSNLESYYPIPDHKTPANFMNRAETYEDSKQTETISITDSVHAPEERENGF